MRRVVPLGAAVVLVLVAFVLSACGSSKSAGNPISSELSYYPANTPFVLTVQTDPKSAAIKNAQSLVRRFRVASFGESALMGRLQQVGINYDADIRPLFGNPIAFGLGGAALGRGARSEFLAVWITKDSSKLDALRKKIFSGAHSSGTRDGATVYQEGSASFAIDGATLVIATSSDILNSALDRHAHGGGISSSTYNSALSSLPSNALVKAYGTLTGILATAKAAKARQIPWVGALRGYAVTLTANSSGISFNYKLDTSGSNLTEAQLPIASGSTPPSLAGNLPIMIAARNPAQFVSFVEAGEQATGSASYANFLKRQAAVRRKTGVDLTTLFNQLSGDLIVESDTHTTIGRVGVKSAPTTAQTLSKLATQPKAFSATASSVTRTGGGFYNVNEPGKPSITIGLVGSELVAGKASPAQLRTFAGLPASPAAGAQGSVAYRVSLPALLQVLLKRTVPQAFQQVLSSLGDITGWTASSTSSVNGVATLAIK